MKRLLFRLAVSVMTFLIGVTSAMIFFRGVTSRELLPASTRPPDTSETAAPKQPHVEPKDAARIKKIADVPFDVDPGFLSMQMVGEREIWLRSRGKLWRTLDGGKNWKLLRNGRNGLYEIYSFQFVNSEVGWLTGYYEGTDHMFKTTDGGQTWAVVSPGKGWTLNSFQFLDEKHGWAAGTVTKEIPKNETRFIRPRNIFGGKDALYAAVYYTEDGGESWRQQPIPSRPNSLTDISMLDAEHGWAWGDAGNFYFDRGRWREINYHETKCGNRRVKVKHLEIGAGNPSVQAASLSFISPQVGWMSHTSGYLAKTTDGARTWCDLLDPEDIWGKQDFPQHYFGIINFLDARHGYALDDGSLHETEDGGAKWSKLDVGVYISSLYVIDAQHVFGASNQGLFKIVPPATSDQQDE